MSDERRPPDPRTDDSLTLYPHGGEREWSTVMYDEWKMAERPKWCPNHECAPLFAHDHDQGFGSSGWCTGRVELPMVTVRGGVRHENDCYMCWRTPRGIAMFEVREGDFEIVARLALRALVALNPGRAFNWRWFTGREEDMSVGDGPEEKNG